VDVLRCIQLNDQVKINTYYIIYLFEIYHNVSTLTINTLQYFYTYDMGEFIYIGLEAQLCLIKFVSGLWKVGLFFSEYCDFIHQ
jgi:hypothetical protein